MYIFSSSAQRSAEADASSRFGITEYEMTGAAASAAMDEIASRIPAPGRAAVLCGKGGNGGDGFALSILLKEEGYEPSIILCSGAPSKEVPLRYLRTAESSGIRVVDLYTEPDAAGRIVETADIIVDAVFGIGFRGSLPGIIGGLFGICRDSRALRISLDVPSGVGSDSGQVDEKSFPADVTVCFIGAKPACVLKGSRSSFGRIVTAGAGVPDASIESAGYALSTDLRMIPDLMPKRPPNSNKGTFGKLAVMAGCKRFRGAASAAANGAYLAGAGLVEIISEEPVLSAASVLCPEAILADISDADAVSAAFNRSTAALAGCGLGRSGMTDAQVKILIREYPRALILDADALNAAAEEPGILSSAKGKLVITPHPGEFARLTGASIQDILADRIGAAEQFSEKNGCTVVLKSENTVIASPGRRTYIDFGGSTGLAKAGSGDLLAGLIAGFAAGGCSPGDAALLGVLVHSASSLEAEKRCGVYSMTARDVMKCIPAVTSEASRHMR
ncbi:MAG: NAD(P)H-hydrate dehydratase [Oscillospiraceae bacterium]|jgi:hydroxyethylthiazole kinase-like uncharacterized protein yjeF